MRISFLGFGLISGSVARALRVSAGPFARAELVGWSPSGGGPRTAVADGILDAAAGTIEEAAEAGDIVVIGAPPLAALELVDRLADGAANRLAPDGLVTDVVSTKAAICTRARARGLRFVGGHPMAGRETSGYGVSDAALFVDRPWVVVADGAAEDDVARVEALATACRARPIRMSAAEHDAATAAISHAPLVAAAALVEAMAGLGDEPAPGWAQAAGLAASGWRDMTRLARGDVDMGAGIVATNGDAVRDRLTALRHALDGWIALLESPGGPDAGAIADRLRSARDRLEGDAGDTSSSGTR